MAMKPSISNMLGVSAGLVRMVQHHQRLLISGGYVGMYGSYSEAAYGAVIKYRVIRQLR